jgi:predicted RNase H-like nuclease (RuvC/YqgF family)
MNKPFFFIMCLLCGAAAQYAAGQVGFGAGMDVTAPFMDRQTDEKKKQPLKDPFVFYFCAHYKTDYVEIRNLQRAGHGRKELITLMLIAQDSRTPIAQVAHKRKKLKPLKKIAEEYNLDYDAIRTKASADKRTIEKAMKTKAVAEEEPPLP